MSRFKRILMRTGIFLGPAAVVLLLLFSAGYFQSCIFVEEEDTDAEHELYGDGPFGRDPLPGELVERTLREDSIRNQKRAQLRSNMSKIISDYRKRFREDHFNGYFLTDLNDDGLPELWVRVGSYRDNSKLELYYPMPDGSLKKSDTFAEPGHYFIGDNHLMQVVGRGPGYININRITIRNGEMEVENLHELDLYADPEASLPQFQEREVKGNSFGNLTPLHRAFN